MGNRAVITTRENFDKYLYEIRETEKAFFNIAKKDMDNAIKTEFENG